MSKISMQTFSGWLCINVETAQVYFCLVPKTS